MTTRSSKTPRIVHLLMNLRIVLTSYVLIKKTDRQNYTNSFVLFRGWCLLNRLHLRFEHYRRGARDPAVFSNSPKMHCHENRSHERNADAVPDIRTQQGIRIDDRSSEQAEAHVIV